MLKVITIDSTALKIGDYSGEELFKRNPVLTFTIKAPLYWWVDCDWIKYHMNMPLNKFEFCLDNWQENSPYIQQMQSLIKNTTLEPRQLMQILPLSTYLTAMIELSYQEVIEVCENWQAGEYEYVSPYSFPNEQEWTDFYNILIQIGGVSSIINRKF